MIPSLKVLTMPMRKSSWEDIKSQAHYLKSSYDDIGFERLARLMASLELPAKESDRETAFANYE